MTTEYICSSCNHHSPSWYGKCPSCHQWNTFKKNIIEKKSKRIQASFKKANIVNLSTISQNKNVRIKTGIFEFDRVLGSGFIAGEVILLAGPPGVGKSTLILKSLSNLKALYAGGEESIEQIKHRVDRLNITNNQIYFTNECQIEAIFKAVVDLGNQIQVIVIDSIQTVYTSQTSGLIGGVSQLKDVVLKIIDFAKSKKIAVILVGHITKEGSVAGPKTLEHLVDCVLYLEGDQASQFRVLRAQKNRFGSTDEIGIFEMTQKGLVEGTKMTFLLDDKTKKKNIGKTIVGIKEGSRSFFYEIECLSTPSYLQIPRRVVSGVDYNRFQLLLAVADKYLKLNLNKFDVYLSVVGGLSVKGTAADLGIIIAIYSSIKNMLISPSAVFIGETGLMGEVRKISGEEKIIAEAKRYRLKPIFNHINVENISNIPLLKKIL